MEKKKQKIESPKEQYKVFFLLVMGIGAALACLGSICSLWLSQRLGESKGEGRHLWRRRTHIKLQILMLLLRHEDVTSKTLRNHTGFIFTCKVFEVTAPCLIGWNSTPHIYIVAYSCQAPALFPSFPPSLPSFLLHVPSPCSSTTCQKKRIISLSIVPWLGDKRWTTQRSKIHLIIANQFPHY